MAEWYADFGPREAGHKIVYECETPEDEGFLPQSDCDEVVTLHFSGRWIVTEIRPDEESATGDETKVVIRRVPTDKQLNTEQFVSGVAHLA